MAMPRGEADKLVAPYMERLHGVILEASGTCLTYSSFGSVLGFAMAYAVLLFSARASPAPRGAALMNAWSFATYTRHRPPSLTGSRANHRGSPFEHHT